MLHAKQDVDSMSGVGALQRRAERAGGRVFAATLLLTAMFVFGLYNLRAEKIFTLPATIEHATAADFSAYWRAGHMAREGDAALAYDAKEFRAGLPPPNERQLWLHPPHFLLVAAPLSFLPFPALKALWIALSVICLLLCARTTSPQTLFYLAVLLSPGAFASALVLQMGPMIAAGLASSLVLAKRRPIVAGVILALLTMKPQYGLMAPIFLAATRAWRAFAVAAIATILLSAISVFIFGVDPWLAFFHSATAGALAEHALALHRDMVSVQASFAKLHFAPPLRAAAQLCATVVSAVAVYFAARRWPRDAAIGFTLLVSAFAAPSVWIYDWPLVAAGLFMLARAASPWPAHLQILAGALWITPLISLGLLTLESSLAAPVIFASALAAFWVWGERLAAHGRALQPFGSMGSAVAH